MRMGSMGMRLKALQSLAGLWKKWWPPAPLQLHTSYQYWFLKTGQKEKRGNHSEWNEDIQTSNTWNLRLSEHPEQTWVYGQTCFEVTFGFSCISKFTATGLKNKATTAVIDFNYWSINCSSHFLYKFGFSWPGKSREPYCQNSTSLCHQILQFKKDGYFI